MLQSVVLVKRHFSTKCRGLAVIISAISISKLGLRNSEDVQDPRNGECDIMMMMMMMAVVVGTPVDFTQVIQHRRASVLNETRASKPV